MKGIVIASAIALAAGGAMAQDTQADKYEAGGLDAFSNMEKQVSQFLLDHDVPLSCVGKLTFNDVATIKSIIDDSSMQGRRGRVTQILRNACQ